MFGTERPFRDVEGPLKKGGGLHVVLEEQVQRCEVADGEASVRMPWTDGTLDDLKGA
jgi:hypothetical protein